MDCAEDNENHDNLVESLAAVEEIFIVVEDNKPQRQRVQEEFLSLGNLDEAEFPLVEHSNSAKASVYYDWSEDEVPAHFL